MLGAIDFQYAQSLPTPGQDVVVPAVLRSVARRRSGIS